MKLSTLAGPEVAVPPGCGEVEIAGITADSREVRPGWLFVALAGAKTDGARFVSDAAGKGAAAILMRSGATADVPAGVPLLTSPEPRRALALMAARLYPAQPAITVAVTGTNGKTSVAEFTRQIFAGLGHQAASLGTIGIVKPAGSVYGGLTTPDPVALHRTLSRARPGGHHPPGVRGVLARPRPVPARWRPTQGRGLHQSRPRPPRLSPDDGGLPRRQAAPVHRAAAARWRGRASTPMPSMRAMCRGRPRCGPRRRHCRPRRRDAAAGGACCRSLRPAHASFATKAQAIDIRLPLIGDYQAANALIAAGLAIAAGEQPARRAAGTGQARRRQRPARDHGAGARRPRRRRLRPQARRARRRPESACARSRLAAWCACSAAAATATRASARSWAASPRRWPTSSSSPTTIRAARTPRRSAREILAGAPAAREIGDRAEAIRAGSRLLGPGDVLLVAGKGHETGQIVGSTVIPFSDHDVVRAVLTETDLA